jgi:hypothetical protein
MLVAASKQTTSIISLKRSASTESWDRDGRPNIPSDAIPMTIRVS